MLQWLFAAELHVMGSTILWREIVGNVFGLTSAVLGMQRRVWAWPIGMAGNLLLLTVFLGAVFVTPQQEDLYGQAGRQVLFFALSAYGLWRWRRGSAGGGPAVVPRWATTRERVVLGALGLAGLAVAYEVLSALGSWGPLADGWILVGSLLATYGMARGLIEFWLVWIAVDAVGVPLLLIAGFYPSALLYAVYGGFCLLGLRSWMRVRAAGPPAGTGAPVAVGAP